MQVRSPVIRRALPVNGVVSAAPVARLGPGIADCPAGAEDSHLELQEADNVIGGDEIAAGDKEDD